MTPEQIEHVQHTFARVAPIAEHAAALFYERLFMLDPNLRPLFKGDMVQQGRMLMQTLALAVRGLQNPMALVPALEQMGQRHVTYGVSEAHYDTVGSALLWTLEQGLGDAYTPAVAAAWQEAYGLLAGVMKAGARKAQAA